jgi:hypothetical protein
MIRFAFYFVTYLLNEETCFKPQFYVLMIDIIV